MLHLWIREVQSNQLPLSGDVAAKALSPAAMGINNFVSSDGLLTRFKHPHDLVFKCVSQPGNMHHMEGRKAIRFAYLPANTTSVLVPMDHGIIKKCKGVVQKASS